MYAPELTMDCPAGRHTCRPSTPCNSCLPAEPAASIAVRIATKNDANGNPRRGWVIFNEVGTLLAFVDEGYEGNAALRRVYPAIADTYHRILVAPREYNNFRKVIK